MDAQNTLSRKEIRKQQADFFLQGDYGGYFVCSKQSAQLSAYGYYKCGKLTSVKLGWNHVHMNHKGTFLKEDYQIKATFSGPSAGVVFHFWFLYKPTTKIKAHRPVI